MYNYIKNWGLKIFNKKTGYKNNSIINIAWWALIIMSIATSLYYRAFAYNNVRGPIIAPDEISYIDNARFITNEQKSERILSTPWVYSVLLLPITHSFSSASSQYLFIIYLNLLLWSVSFYLTSALLHNIIENRIISFLATLIALSYPSYLVYSGLAMTENLFILVNLSVLYIINLYIRNLQQGKDGSIILIASMGFLSVVSFMTRTNGIVLGITLTIFMLLHYQLTKKKIVIKGLITYMVSVGITLLLYQYINRTIFSGDIIIQGNNTVSQQLFKILSLDGILLYIKVIVGQTFYLSYSSFGLLWFVPISILFSIKHVRKIISENKRYFRGIVILGISTLLLSLNLLVSSLFMVGGNRGDHIIYGRYNEPLLILFLTSTFLVSPFLFKIIKKWNKYKLLFVLLLSYTITTLFIFLAPTWEIKPFNPFNVLMLYPIIARFGANRDMTFMLFSIVYAGLSLFLYYYYIGKRDIAKGIGLLLSFIYLFIGYDIYYQYYLRGNESRYQYRQITHSPIDESIKRICYDKSNFVGWNYYIYQYYFYQYSFVDIPSTSDSEIRMCDAVITSKTAKNPYFTVAREETLEDQVLWIREK